MSERWRILVATSLGSSLAFLDSSVVNVALPAIREDLDFGLAGQQWAVLAYVLALGACYLAAGAVADRIGLRRGFVIGTVGFAVASLIVGAAPNELSLVAARVLQGIAASLLTTTSLALLRVSWGEDSGRAIGLWTSFTSAAILAGPPIGGIVVELASWRWIFLANVPLAALTLLAIANVRPATSGDELTELPPRPDIASLALSTLALALVIGALVETRSLGPLWTGALLALALVPAFAAWHRQRSGATALVPSSLLRGRVFASTIAATLFIYAALGALGFFASVYLQSGAVDYSAFEAGIVQVPTTILLLALAPTFGRLADAHGPRRWLVLGPILLAAGCTALATVDSQSIDFVSGAPWIGFRSFDLLLPGMVLCGLGLAMLVSPITSTALRAAPDSQAGIASAVSNLAARTGTLLAIALLGLAAAWTFSAQGAPHGVEAFGETATRAAAAADEAAWRVTMFGCAALSLLGGLIAWIGLRGTTGTVPVANEL